MGQSDLYISEKDKTSRINSSWLHTLNEVCFSIYSEINQPGSIEEKAQ